MCYVIIELQFCFHIILQQLLYNFHYTPNIENKMLFLVYQHEFQDMVLQTRATGSTTGSIPNGEESFGQQLMTLQNLEEFEQLLFSGGNSGQEFPQQLEERLIAHKSTLHDLDNLLAGVREVEIWIIDHDPLRTITPLNH